MLLICTAAVGCAPVIQLQDGRTLRATDEEFRDHAEAVFRRQNSILVEIGERIESVAPHNMASADALARAEGRILQTCAPLNQLAIAHRDGKTLSKSRLWQVAKSVPECDAATRGARALLDRESVRDKSILHVPIENLDRTGFFEGLDEAFSEDSGGVE